MFSDSGDKGFWWCIRTGGSGEKEKKEGKRRRIGSGDYRRKDFRRQLLEVRASEQSTIQYHLVILVFELAHIKCE